MLFSEDLDSLHTSTHDNSIYKGLAAFIGIYVFYLIETAMQLKQIKPKNNKVQIWFFKIKFFRLKGRKRTMKFGRFTWNFKILLKFTFIKSEVNLCNFTENYVNLSKTLIIDIFYVNLPNSLFHYTPVVELFPCNFLEKHK